MKCFVWKFRTRCRSYALYNTFSTLVLIVRKDVVQWVVIENYMFFLYDVGENRLRKSLIQFVKHVGMHLARLDNTDVPSSLSVSSAGRATWLNTQEVSQYGPCYCTGMCKQAL